MVNTAYSPTLKRWIGLALVNSEYAYVGLDYRTRGVSARKCPTLYMVRDAASPPTICVN